MALTKPGVIVGNVLHFLHVMGVKGHLLAALFALFKQTVVNGF